MQKTRERVHLVAATARLFDVLADETVVVVAELSNQLVVRLPDGDRVTVGRGDVVAHHQQECPHCRARALPAEPAIPPSQIEFQRRLRRQRR
jgi:hypothetical protein